jgi:predicted Zn-dependent protease
LAYTPRVSLAQPLLLQGRTDEAIKQMETAIAANPLAAFFVSSYLSHAYAAAGRWQEASALADQFMTRSGRTPIALSSQGMLLAEAGKMKEAEQLLDELTVRARREHVQPLTFAHLLISMKRYDEAFARLEESFKLKESLVLSLRVFPEFRNPVVEADPRYKSLLTRMGLTPR